MDKSFQHLAATFVNQTTLQFGQLLAIDCCCYLKKSKKEEVGALGLWLIGLTVFFFSQAFSSCSGFEGYYFFLATLMSVPLYQRGGYQISSSQASSILLKCLIFFFVISPFSSYSYSSQLMRLLLRSSFLSFNLGFSLYFSFKDLLLSLSDLQFPEMVFKNYTLISLIYLKAFESFQVIDTIYVKLFGYVLNHLLVFVRM